VNPALRALRFAHSRLPGDVGARLGQALAGNEGLTDLDLSYNALGDAGALAVASALRLCPALRALNLAANGIGEIGAQAFVQALGPAAPRVKAVESSSSPPVSPSSKARGPGWSPGPGPPDRRMRWGLSRVMSPSAPKAARPPSDSFVKAGGDSLESASESDVHAVCALVELRLESNAIDPATASALRVAWVTGADRDPDAFLL